MPARTLCCLSLHQFAISGFLSYRRTLDCDSDGRHLQARQGVRCVPRHPERFDPADDDWWRWCAFARSSRLIAAARTARAVSLCAVLVMTYLFLAEFLLYLTPEIQQEMFVDRSEARACLFACSFCARQSEYRHREQDADAANQHEHHCPRASMRGCVGRCAQFTATTVLNSRMPRAQY